MADRHADDAAGGLELGSAVSRGNRAVRAANDDPPRGWQDRFDFVRTDDDKAAYEQARRDHELDETAAEPDVLEAAPLAVRQRDAKAPADRPPFACAPRVARLSGHLQSELARLAGVSPSAMSQAERGQRGLSLETLLELTGKLNMTLDELLRGEVVSGYRLGRRRHPHSRRVGRGHQPLPLLDDPAAGLRAYLVHLPPRASGSPHVTHKGTELVTVANGLVQVVLASGRPVLRRGEVLLVEATTIERWRNLGPAEATLFWILRD